MVIDKINFPIYGVIILVSFVIGCVFNYIFLKKNKVERKDIALFTIMLFVLALSGGEMLSFLTSDVKSEEVRIYGLSSYGGAIGVILSGIIFEKIKPYNKIIIKSSIISLPLIYSISKLACFFAGCCYGLPYDGVGCVIYPLGLNVPLIPVQLLETVTFMIIFIICILLMNNKNIISITVILSAISKFLLDYLRYDHLEKTITTNQIISIVFVFIGIIMIVNKFRKKKINTKEE